MSSPNDHQPEENDKQQHLARTELSPGESSSVGSAGVVATDPISQMRTTLAIGELIASSRPSAGSRLIANEIRSLTDAFRDENAALRREIESLGSNLCNSFKNIMEEENERRTAVRGFMPRRFPVFRRPPRFPFARQAQTARKSLGPTVGIASTSSSSNQIQNQNQNNAASTSTSSSSNSNTNSNSTSTSFGNSSNDVATTSPASTSSSSEHQI